MCPRPGTILNITATMSLALPSAVCVAPRTQSQRSQRSASFGRRCPQYGHGILSPVVGSGRAVGASVYSTFIFVESHKPHRIRQAKRDSVEEADELRVRAAFRNGMIFCLQCVTPLFTAQQRSKCPEMIVRLAVAYCLFTTTRRAGFCNFNWALTFPICA